VDAPGRSAHAVALDGAGGGWCAGQGAAGRRGRHRQGDQRGQVWRGPAGRGVPDYRPRELGPGGGGGPKRARDDPARRLRGSLGLLAALAMRLRGLEVTCYSRRPAPYLNSNLIAALGGHYVSAQDMSVGEAGAKHGPFDIIMDATGYSPVIFEAAEALAKNG